MKVYRKISIRYVGLSSAIPRCILSCLQPSKVTFTKLFYLHHTLDGLTLGAEYDFDTSVLKKHINLNEFTLHVLVLDEVEPTYILRYLAQS